MKMKFVCLNSGLESKVCPVCKTVLKRSVFGLTVPIVILTCLGSLSQKLVWQAALADRKEGGVEGCVCILSNLSCHWFRLSHHTGQLGAP